MLETSPKIQPTRTTHPSVALVGNPNTGKSTIFNALTGYHQRVGNYPGVTVETRTGMLRGGSTPIELIDLPGAYSLAAASEEEAVLLDLLAGRRDQCPAPHLIVVVVDAANLGRNLFLASQVFELGRPVIIALNMVDVAEASGVHINADDLARELGVPVLPVVATKRRGFTELVQAIGDSLNAVPPTSSNEFPDIVRNEVREFSTSIAERRCDVGTNGVYAEAVQTLLGPDSYHEHRLVQLHGQSVRDEINERRARIETAGESLAEVEARVRYRWIDDVVRRSTLRNDQVRRSTTERIDRIVTHRVLGIVVFGALMTFCFQAMYTWAGPVMEMVDGAFAVAGAAVGGLIAEGPLRSLVADGVIAGVGAVLIFLPQILILFLFLAILEDCGYMARAAFLLDRWMGFIGLSGNSFVPLLSSFACAVPGIIATRNIASRRDRLVTILIAPLMSCSARLPVYVLLIGAFVPAKPLLGGIVTLQPIILLSLYLFGILVAIPVALILKTTILKGKTQPFLLEMPSYKRPSFRTVLYRMYSQGKEFCISAGTIIIAVTIIVWALGYYPHPRSIAKNHEMQRVSAQQRHDQRSAEITPVEGRLGEFAELREQLNAELHVELTRIEKSEAGEYLRQSVLGRMGRWIEPVVRPLGWDWRIGTAVIASFPAREVVIATMGTIYNLGDGEDESSTGLREKLRAATWPDGRPVFSLAVALSIMVFFALCCQCGATLATIRRETRSWRWPVVTFTYMTALAYVAALLTYQIASRVT